MAVDDVLVPSFRDQAAQLLRGVTPVELLLYWGGDERGSDFAGPRADFPISVPVGSHVPHAAGVALAMKLHHEARAALCIIGDGATSKGDFYEALNVAGVWHLPLVILICNNQWSISVARLRRYLVSQGVWSRDKEEQALARAATVIDRAAEEYLATPPQPVSAMFDYLFAELPASLAAQRAQAVAEEPDDA